MNENLRRAQQILDQGVYTCVLCKDHITRTCTTRGVRPLLELLEEGDWHQFSAADKVVGKASAFLYVLLGIEAVYAPVMSESARQVLEAHGIRPYYETLVPAIFNRSRSGFCPMETTVKDIDTPSAALEAIRAEFARLNR